MTERHVHLLGTTVPQVTLEFKRQQTRCLPLTTHVGVATILFFFFFFSLPKLMLTDHQWGLVAFTWGQYHKKCSRYLPFIRVSRVLSQTSNKILSTSPLASMYNANPLYGVTTICHQVRWLRWVHPSLFHTATSLLI